MKAQAIVALALLGGATAFTTTLHGGADEATPVGAPGAATLLLQPWLTNYDPDVRLCPLLRAPFSGVTTAAGE